MTDLKNTPQGSSGKPKESNITSFEKVFNEHLNALRDMRGKAKESGFFIEGDHGLDTVCLSQLNVKKKRPRLTADLNGEKP